MKISMSKFYSYTTMREHKKDLQDEALKTKLVDEGLRYFITNMYQGIRHYPMIDLAYTFPREWAATGLLNLHDLTQECYVALIRAYGRTNWEVINSSTNKEASLWAYLKRSIKLDVRKEINKKRDGIRTPDYKVWEDFDGMYFDNQIRTYPMDWAWWEINEALMGITDYQGETFDNERLGNRLEELFQQLTQVERQVIKMNFGMDEPGDNKRGIKYIANHFGISPSTVKRIKASALEQLNTDENKELMRDFLGENLAEQRAYNYDHIKD